MKLCSRGFYDYLTSVLFSSPNHGIIIVLVLNSLPLKTKWFSSSHLVFCSFNYLKSVKDLNCSFFYLLILHLLFKAVSSSVYSKAFIDTETIHEGMVKFIYCVYPFLSDFLLDYNEFRASKKYNESFEKEWIIKKFSNFYSIHRK